MKMKRTTLMLTVVGLAFAFWTWTRGPEPLHPPAPHWLVDEPHELILRSPAGYQTVTEKSGERTGLYYDSGELVGQLRPSSRVIALLGMGGGEMLRAAWRSLPNDGTRRRLIGVEIDPKTAAIAVDTFHVDRFGAEVVVGDALDWVVMQPKGSVDVLLIDVYADSVLPDAFRRLAFFVDCYRALRPISGLLLMNVWPAELVPKVRKALDVLFTVTERRYGANVVLVAEVR